MATATASKPSKSSKPSKAAKAAPTEEVLDAPAEAPASTEEAPGYDAADGFGVADFPVADVKLNNSRVPTDAQVDEMAKSIQKNGLLNPIIVDANGEVIAGNTRVMAFRKLGRKTIPARFAVDAKGNPVTREEAAATIQTLVENLSRNDMSMQDLGKYVANAIKLGHAASERELATRIGVSASRLNKAVQIATKAASAVSDAITSGELSVDAACAIVNRCATEDAQRMSLETIRKAVAGKLKDGESARKIEVADVEEVVPQKERGQREGKSRAGRPPEKAALSAESTNAEKSGVRIVLRKADGGMNICVDMQIFTDVKTFARFDIEKVIQKAAAAMDAQKVRTELEVARGRLGVGA